MLFFQFTRYLAQQVSSDLPEKSGSSSSDEDEDSVNWLTDASFSQKAAADFSIGREETVRFFFSSVVSLGSVVTVRFF
jgi:hypothetical protein